MAIFARSRLASNEYEGTTRNEIARMVAEKAIKVWHPEYTGPRGAEVRNTEAREQAEAVVIHWHTSLDESLNRLHKGYKQLGGV